MTGATAEELPLRDIHLPTAVDWWPPAPGWWILLLTLLIAMAALLVLKYLRQRRKALRTVALRELALLEQRYRETGDARHMLEQLSSLVRRVALSYLPRDQVASLTGEAWLQSLDRLFGGGDFTSGTGRLLASEPYVRCPETDGETLLALCRQAFARLPAKRLCLGDVVKIDHA